MNNTKWTCQIIFIGVCVIEVVSIGRQKVKVSGRNYIDTVFKKTSKKKVGHGQLDGSVVLNVRDL